MKTPARLVADPPSPTALNASGRRYAAPLRAWLACVMLLTGLVIAGNVVADTPAAGSYAGGNGTEGDPFQISNLAELRKFMESSAAFPQHAWYKLTATIDAADTSTWLGGLGWQPVSASAVQGTPLQGFDGQNFEIQNLYINRPAADNVGFFQDAGSCCQVITNVRLIGGQITGRDSVGALVGAMVGPFAPITNSHSTVTINGRSKVGGLAGVLGSGSVTGSSAGGAVTGTSDFVGGLAGQALATTISSSHATGDVKGLKATGGLIGTFSGGNQASALLTTSFATGKVDGDDRVGGLVGESTGKVTFSYATGAVTATGVVQSNVGYAHVGGLIGIQDNHVTEDSWASGAVSGPFKGVGGLIGSNAGSISRSFTIAGQTVTGGASGSFVGGLVGDNQGAITASRSASTVLANGTGVEAIGGLVGVNSAGGGISNSYATGNVTATGASKVGGLVGWQVVGGITGNHAHGNVSGGAQWVGGLIGFSSTPPVTNNYATGMVSGTAQVGGLIGFKAGGGLTDIGFALGAVTATGDYVGGLIGRNGGTLRKSFAKTGSVTGHQWVGGLVGYNEGTIETSYAIKSVTGDTNVGGLVGLSFDGLSFGIKDCYAKGSVSGNDKVGGLVGRNESISNIAHCYASGTVGLIVPGGSIGALIGDNQRLNNYENYWNSETTASPGIGFGQTAGATGLTAAQMKQPGSFTGFVFPSPWLIDPGVTEPYLSTEPRLDVDVSISATKYDRLTDGMLIVRYLFGMTGGTLVTDATGATATRADPAAIKTYLDSLSLLLDIDGNGSADALTDGVLIIRYLSGLTGDALIAGAVDLPLAIRKTAPEIEAWIQLLLP